MSSKPQTVEEEEAPAEPAPRGGRGLFRIIKAVAFVSVVVVVQVVVASMLIPTSKDTEKLAQDLSAASKGETESDHDNGDPHGSSASSHGGGGDHGEGIVEMELGTYNVTRFNPGTNTTLAIDFQVYVTVLAEEATEFEHRLEKSKARIREQIMLTMHGANSTDLTDAGLGLIKRQILEKTNRSLGQPLVKEVLFSKFNFVER
ncbi:MAG: flagellar basal body-associated FliL family protein [Pirellulales bacterium]|nr:flagellar basal body-associated FliL family protein [Pirellulales bacterium]